MVRAASMATIIDTNVYLSRWPFRRLFGDEPHELMAKLRQAGVEQAWAGSFDALLHQDLGAVNERLAGECRRWGDGMLLPFGCVNPRLPDWKEELRRCVVEHRMNGIRLHPNFHGYQLDDVAARELLGTAAERGIAVQIAAMMEDDRTVHPLVRVTMADLKPLPGLCAAIKGLRVQLMNYRGLAPAFIRELARSGEVYFDFSMIEGVHGLRRLAADVPADRLVFGSYFPFYYHEAASLKVKEAELTASAMAANARKLLGALR